MRPMGFDRLAPFYPAMEFVLAGNKLQRCRTAFLGSIPTPENILMLGEGHGRCLVACRRRFPAARIVCLDSSQGMLTQARKALRCNDDGSGAVEFLLEDIREWNPPAFHFDLVITNFFLDCFGPEELVVLIPRVSEACRKGASWMVADFKMANAGWRRWRSHAILWIMYRFFRATTGIRATGLTSPDLYLKTEGFRLQDHKESEWGLLKCDWWRMCGTLGEN